MDLAKALNIVNETGKIKKAQYFEACETIIHKRSGLISPVFISISNLFAAYNKEFLYKHSVAACRCDFRRLILPTRQILHIDKAMLKNVYSYTFRVGCMLSIMPWGGDRGSTLLNVRLTQNRLEFNPIPYCRGYNKNLFRIPHTVERLNLKEIKEKLGQKQAPILRISIAGKIYGLAWITQVNIGKREVATLIAPGLKAIPGGGWTHYCTNN